MDINSFAPLAATVASRNPDFDSFHGFTLTVSAYGVVYPDLNSNAQFLDPNWLESLGSVLEASYTNQSGLYDTLDDLLSDLPSLETQQNKEDWYNLFMSISPFNKGNDIVGWILWNVINNSLENPTDVPA